jgi:hypothetical protein
MDRRRRSLLQPGINECESGEEQKIDYACGVPSFPEELRVDAITVTGMFALASAILPNDHDSPPP